MKANKTKDARSIIGKRQTLNTVIQKRDAGSDTLEISVSSNVPYERFFGYEVLSHKPGAIITDRLDAGAAPLLWNHNTDEQIGVVESFQVEDEERGVALVRFSKNSDMGKVVSADVADGIRRNVSIGYVIHELDGPFESPDSDIPVYIATKWEIMEVSIVSVPADFTVGVGRSVVDEPDDEADTDNTTDEGDPEEELEDPEEEATETPEEELLEEENEKSKQKSVEISNSPIIKNEATQPAEHISDLITTNLAKSEAVAETKQMEVNNDKSATGAEDIAKRSAELVDLAVKNGMTERASKWIAESYSLDRAKAEILDSKTNAGKVNIPLMAGTSEGLTKGDRKALDVRNAIANHLQGGDSELAQEGRKFAKENKLSLRDGSLPIPMDLPIFTRTMTTVQANGGQNFVSNEYYSLQAALRENSLAARIGVEIQTGIANQIVLPQILTGSSLVWAGEAGAGSDFDLVAQQATWSPKSAIISVPYSRTLGVMNGDYDVEQITRQDILAAVVEGFETAIFAGTGTSNQPTGLLNDANIPLSNSGSAGGFSYSRAVNMWKTQRSNKGGSNGAFVITPGAYQTGLTSVQFTGSYSPAILGGVPGSGGGTIAGLPVFASNFMPTNAGVAANKHGLVYGDFSKVLAVTFGVFEIVSDPYSAGANGIIKLRGYLMMDSKARQPRSLVRDLDCLG